jgi:hypothetical protein
MYGPVWSHVFYEWNCVWNFVFEVKGRKQIEFVQEQGAEENSGHQEG